jgi:6-phosphogluconolactonase (cycloisomerase 2 family)
MPRSSLVARANACAEIRVNPSGKFMYVPNRGHDSIAAFALDD